MNAQCSLLSGTSHKSKVVLILGVIGGIFIFFIFGGCLIVWLKKGKLRGYKREIFVDVAGRFRKGLQGSARGQHKSSHGAVNSYESPGVAVHKTLLRLIGFCTTPTERLLVYLYMPNLSVAHCLRGIVLKIIYFFFLFISYVVAELYKCTPTKIQMMFLSALIQKSNLGTKFWIGQREKEWLWAQLGDLNTCTNPKIIHRDVKAANVLLDEDFEAVVGDFGLAQLVDVRKTNVTTQVRGTMGHIAPEYLSTGKSSERTDVFGYGIMLLELVTGQRTIDFARMEEEDDVLLLDHVKKLEREKRLADIIDHNLLNYNMEEVEMMVQVALLCTWASPEDRPAMSSVVRMLEGEGLAERWEEWQNVEVTRRHQYERLQRRFDWGKDSVYDQEAIELSGGR
ncbi:hypothetical protein QQ045_023045 [Rhodiola kirilowii]